jgi:tetratricopeptide (TPR) repeat protein
MMASRNRLTTLVLAGWIIIILGQAAIARDFKNGILAALESQDTTQVLALLEGEIKTDPAYAPNYLLKGKIFYARGQYDDALVQFELALKKKAKLYEALYYKGLIDLEHGKLDEVEKAFKKGINKSKEEKALFHNGMGLLLMKKENYLDADLEFSRAIQIGPDMAEFHVNKGDANYFNKFYPLAIQQYNQVIEMDTTYLDVYFRLARAYVKQRQYTDAVDQLQTVLKRDTLYIEAWKEIGRLYTMAGQSAGDRDTKDQRFKEAIGSYHKYLDLSKDSADGEIFFNIGRSYFSIGGYAQADSAFEYVLSLGDEPKGIHLYLGRGHLIEENYEKGIEHIGLHLANLETENPNWQPGPEEADLYRRIADAYKALEDYASAAEFYIRAHELVQDNAYYANAAAFAYHRLQDYPSALEYYDKRIAIGPDAWGIYMNAAKCLVSMEDYESSIDYLLKVVELKPDELKAIVHLSNNYLYHLQDCENGTLWTKKVIEMDSTNCEALKSLGFAYFGGTCPPNYLTAINYFKKALDCFKATGANNCGNNDIIVYIAQAYHLHAAELLENDKKEESKKYFKDAFDWYNKCLKCEPGNADCKKGVSDTEFEF